MPRLGVLLVRAGAVSEENVHRALAVQGFTGGRIGTLLLERGSVSEDDVGKALSEQHGCDYVPWRTLGSIPAPVIAALPAKFAIRHSALPVEVGEGFVRVVLRDPANLRILDELFFVTGKKIIPAAAPEVRIYQALEKYYGERRTPRFAILAEKLSRPIAAVRHQEVAAAAARLLGRDPAPAGPGASGSARSGRGRAAPTWNVPDLPPVGWGGLPAPPTRDVPVEAEPESIPWEELPGARSAADARRPPASARSPRFPRRCRRPPGGAACRRPREAPPSAPPDAGMPTAADFGDMLAARDRDGVFDAALRAMRRRFARSAVFAVRPEGIVGLVRRGRARGRRPPCAPSRSPGPSPPSS